MPRPLLRAVAHVLLLATLTSTLGCVRNVAAPPAPPRAMPALDAEPVEPAGGMARVFLDTDVPARVVRITTGSVDRENPHLLRPTRAVAMRELVCEATPCAVTLPYGDHELTFEGLADAGRESRTTIRVRRATEVVNHSLGQDRTSGAAFFGGLLAATGVVLAIFAGYAASDPRYRGSDAPTGLAIGGAVGMIGGLSLAAAFPHTRQDGATTQWSPGPSAPAVRAVGGGFALRF